MTTTSSKRGSGSLANVGRLRQFRALDGFRVFALTMLLGSITTDVTGQGFYAAASAQIIVEQVGESPAIDAQQTGTLFGSLSASANAIGAVNSGRAVASAAVNNGALSAFAQAVGGTAAQGVIGRAGSAAVLGDTLTLVSNSLPPGSVVTLAFSLAFSRQVEATGCAGNVNSQAVAIASVVAPNVSMTIQDHSCFGVTDTGPAVAQFVIGQQVVIGATLTAEASSGPTVAAIADAGQTLRFFIDPLGDFSYVTASGNTYLSDESTPFAHLRARADIVVTSRPGGDLFDMEATFLLAADSNGIDPLTEDVTVILGPASWVIPAGSFRQRRDGWMTFQGTQESTRLWATLLRLRDDRWVFAIFGTGAQLGTVKNPVLVRLRVGDDAGAFDVLARIILR